MSDFQPKYCKVCGTKLELRECAGESGPIPFCPKCGEFRFTQFNVAVCTAIFNSDFSKVLMMRQYGREMYNFLAGYVNVGETAEEALPREMREEMGISPVSSEFLYTFYFAKTNTLMVNFLTVANTMSLDGMSKNEVDDAQWFTFDEAVEHVIKGGGAEKLINYVKNRFK